MQLVRKRCLIKPNSDFLLQAVGVVFFTNAAETGEGMERAEKSGSRGAVRQRRQPTHTDRQHPPGVPAFASH